MKQCFGSLKTESFPASHSSTFCGVKEDGEDTTPLATANKYMKAKH
jgi:hypothetical protein